MRNEGMATDKALGLALRLAIAIQEPSSLVNLIYLGPMMRENTKHITSATRQTPMDARR
jgi:hypothetical protein